MQPYQYSVRVDQARNVIYIVQSGRPKAEDFERLKAEFIDGLKRIERGFAIINDQRELEPFDDRAMAVARELVALTNEHGASKVIRILPADLVSKTKLSRTLIAGKSHYENIRVSTPEEAEAALLEP